MADCLVPKWGPDEVFTSRPCHEKPCLHRLLTECPADRIAEFAGRYGLLAFSIPRHLVERKVRAAEVFAPEPMALWQDQIRRLRSATELWDAIVGGDEAALRRLLRQPESAKRTDLPHQARALLGRKITERMAAVRFDLTASPEGKNDQFVMRYKRLRLIDAIWQRFAEENRRPDRVRKVPGTEVRPVVPPQRRAR